MVFETGNQVSWMQDGCEVIEMSKSESKPSTAIIIRVMGLLLGLGSSLWHWLEFLWEMEQCETGEECA